MLAGTAALRLVPAGTLSARPGLPAVLALRGLLAASFGCAEAFMPLLLTQRGWPLLHAGWVLSAAAVSWSAGSAVQARIKSATSRRRALGCGLLLVAASMGTLAVLLGLAAPQLLAAGLAWALAGFGIGLAYPMLSVLTLQLSAPAEEGRNASALQLAEALCASAALAVAGVLAVGAAPGHVLTLSAGLGLAGVLLAPRAFAGAAAR